MRVTETSLKISCLTIFLVGGWTLAAVAADTKLTSQDSGFLKQAAKGNIAEVELAKLAVQKSSNSQVKAFANMMIRDHSKANRELEALASSKGVDLPTGKGLGEDITAAHLKMLSGKSFDEAYIKAMTDDHKEDVAAFQKESESADDPDVKSFATKILPTLQTHLSKIEQLQPGS